MDSEADDSISLWFSDWLEDEYKKNDTHVHTGNEIPSLPGKHIRTSCGTPHKNSIFKFANEFLIKLKHHLNCNLSDVCNFSRVCLLVVNKNNLNPLVLGVN